MQIIRDLGFLQIDAVHNVVRVQDYTLWSRNRSYRERILWPLLRQRVLFEHFTHDASLISMETYPLWPRQFRRRGALRTSDAAAVGSEPRLDPQILGGAAACRFDGMGPRLGPCAGAHRERRRQITGGVRAF